MGLKYRIKSVRVEMLADEINNRPGCSLTWESPYWVISMVSKDTNALTIRKFDNLDDVANVALRMKRLLDTGKAEHETVPNVGPGTVVGFIEYTQYTAPNIKARFCN